MLLPQTEGWTHEFAIVNYHQSGRCLPKLSGHHKINFLFSLHRFLMAHAKVLFDVVCDLVLEHFELKNLKYLRRKVSTIISSLQVWLLAANMKETTVKSISNHILCEINVNTIS